jgi:pimeloyl-ACP methyl ester carboxylesterase
MKPPLHHRRALARLAAAGIAWERGRMPRPAAGGEAAWVRLHPRGGAVARVVVAHGANNDALYPLLPLFEALVGAGMEVFAFDLDGNGWESTTRYARDTAPRAVGDGVRAAGAGRAPLPLHLVGHSLGGSLALRALADGDAGEAASLVLLSSPLRVEFGARTAAAELAGFLAPATAALRRYYGWWGLVPAVGRLKRAAYPFRWTPPSGDAFGYVGEVQALLDALALERAAPAVRVPTLLVYGEGDALVPPAQGERLAALLPHAQLVRVPRACHFAVPFHPAAIARSVSWLAAHTAGMETTRAAAAGE